MALLHGFAGTVAAWDDVVRALPKDLAILRVCLPGHHPDVASNVSFHATCDAIAAQLRNAASNRFHLVGYSLGARLALGMTIRNPSLVCRLSLIGGHIGLPSENERRARRDQDEHWQKILLNSGIEAFVSAWEKRPIFSHQHVLGKVKNRAQRQMRLSHDAVALAASLKSTGLGAMPFFGPSLQSIGCPVEFFAGEYDDKFVAIAKDALSSMTNTSVTVVPGCGHNILLESPEILASLLSKAKQR